MIKSISSPKAPQAIGPYSQAVGSGGLVFVSGQIPLTSAGQLIPGGIAPQTQQCLQNISEILAAAGLKLSDVVKTTVYLTNLAEFQRMNEVYTEHFTAPYPARATVQVAALPRGALVEIDAIAARSSISPA